MMPSVCREVSPASHMKSNSGVSTEITRHQSPSKDTKVGCTNGYHNTDAGSNDATPKSGKKLNSSALMELSTRHEIVELIDIEPTFDYLVLHGVLSRNDVADVLNEPDPVRQNQRMLEFVEARTDIASTQLLTNVLRLTGQHYLANLLDDGARIKALSGSGYLSKSRHRGQVGITLRIVSMQMPSDPQLKTVSALLGTEWISLEDIQTKMSSLKRSQRSSMAQPDALCVKTVDSDVNQPADDEQREKSTCCCWCCCCCCCPHQSSKKKSSTEKYAVCEPPAESTSIQRTLLHEQSDECKKSLVVTYQPGRTKAASVECVALEDMSAGHLGSNMNSLRRAADSVQGKCTAIYSKINENGTPLRAAIERYFEQDRGVLVLNTESLGVGSGVTVNCICTLGEHVQKLRDDEKGRLAIDLERVISTSSGTLVHLDVKVDDNELDLAELEMSSR